MKKNNVESDIKKMYSGSVWISFFTRVRFITGSFVQLEKLIPKKGKVLDLGCGYGILANYLALSSPKRQIIGIDMDLKKIKHANLGLRNTSFSVGDATKMKLENLDCIILHDVLHHLESYGAQKKLIKDCENMLNKKGMLLIVDVDKKPLWKLALGRMTDFVLYKGQPVYYLYRESMIFLLEEHFFPNNIRIQKFYRNPFPQVGYICKKE